MGAQVDRRTTTAVRAIGRRLAGRLAVQDGAALVEAAIVTPVFVALLLGMFTGGLAYSQHNAINNAAREGARYGATLPVNGSMATWLGRVADATKEAASGELADDVEGQYVCVAYVHPAGTMAADRTTRLVESEGVRATPENGTNCFNDGRPNGERRVQVLVERQGSIQALIYADEFQMTGRSAVRFERYE